MWTDRQAQHESKQKLLDATLSVVRAKGYSATRVEDVCAEAGLTKGSFFHHFKSKDELGLAAAAHWNACTADIFAQAAYHSFADPLDRVLGYIDLRKSMLTGALAEFTCFAGTVIQETYDSHPTLSAACESGISEHVRTLESDIRAAMTKKRIRANWSAESLALHTQVVIQGALVLAKARGGAKVALESLDHLRRYIEFLFTQPASAPRSVRKRIA